MQASQDKLKNFTTDSEKLKHELSRLRKHAINKEDEHEEEMLIVKERENQALTELAKVQTRLKNLQFSDASEGQKARIEHDQVSEALRVATRERQVFEQKTVKLDAKCMEYERQLAALQQFLQNLQQEQQYQYEEQIGRTKREAERLKGELKDVMEWVVNVGEMSDWVKVR